MALLRYAEVCGALKIWPLFSGLGLGPEVIEQLGTVLLDRCRHVTEDVLGIFQAHFDEEDTQNLDRIVRELQRWGVRVPSLAAELSPACLTERQWAHILPRVQQVSDRVSEAPVSCEDILGMLLHDIQPVLWLWHQRQFWLKRTLAFEGHLDTSTDREWVGPLLFESSGEFAASHIALVGQLNIIAANLPLLAMYMCSNVQHVLGSGM